MILCPYCNKNEIPDWADLCVRCSEMDIPEKRRLEAIKRKKQKQADKNSPPAVVIPLSGQELKDFDEASNHDLACKCSKCEKWWVLVGSDDEEDIDDTAPAF